MADTLEGRYRRLLAWYPREHRRRYGEEMLGVLLSGAAPEQRKPGFGESLDLLWNAMWRRLGRTGGAMRDTEWRSAAAAFGILGALLLAVRHLRAPLEEWAWSSRLPGHERGPGPEFFMWGLLWTVVAVLAIAGFRRVAAGAAALTLISEITYDVAFYYERAVPTVYSFWALVLGVTTAIALTVRGRQPLTRLQIGLFAFVAALMAGSSSFDALTANVDVHEGGYGIGLLGGFNGNFMPGIRMIGIVGTLIFLAGLVVLMGILIQLGGPIRRRVVAILAPAVVMFVILHATFGGWAMSSPRFNPPVLLVSSNGWS